MDNQIIEYLKGKKTYVLAVVVVLIVVVENILGIDIPQIDTTAEPINYIVGALGLSALRAGVTKSGK